MKLEKRTLQENLHQIIFAVIQASLEEAKEGFCTEIRVSLFPDGSVKISDNGRGIPLSENSKVSQRVLDKILSGQPITNVEYAQMGDFSQCDMETVNSLCESLQITVYRGGDCFRQDYVRGIAQHEVTCRKQKHSSGTEIVLKPDTAIFGAAKFSVEVLKEWIEEYVDAALNQIIVID